MILLRKDGAYLKRSLDQLGYRKSYALFAEYIGFTTKELYNLFKEPIIPVLLARYIELRLKVQDQSDAKAKKNFPRPT